jgi:hypothetical protein
LTLGEFLKISLRVGPLLADIEKLACKTPVSTDKTRLWAIREEIFEIYQRFWSLTKGVQK